MCKLNYLVLVVNFVGLPMISASSILQNGQCETISLYVDFNVTEFAGTWIESRRTGSLTEGSDCSTLEVNETDTDVTFRNRAVDNNFLVVTEGYLNITDGVITLNSSDGQTFAEVRVLFVNYNAFALLYSCENVGETNRLVTVYLLEREDVVLTEMMNELIASLLNTNFGLAINALRPIDHSAEACFELPVIEPGLPVVLDGLCDTNIPAVPDFRVDEFVGLWHQIGSYYSESSVGTCSRAEYSLGDDVVNVLNSEVINQALFSISGNATVSSVDGSGRLRVVLEVAPGLLAEQDLFILGTDYSSFAVSYSCVNLPETNQRRVFSWILSKSPQITSITQNLIDQTLNSFLDLNQRYYQDTPRSNDDCFYFPVPDGTPVTFRGPCDQSIPVMPDFDPTQYVGMWHSIQSYPSQFAFGSCVNAEYTLRDDGTIGVVNTQVVGERLLTIEGTAVIPNASEPAKLLVTFPIEGTNLTTSSDYWILDTDYTTYSLVYTCVDILATNERSVTSWKMSKTKSLNSTVLSLMDDIIDTIPVLNNSYYQQEDQSLSGCFYYPDPVPGQVVVFPGHCEDIATVQNFNLTAFAGTWVEVESYPKAQPTQPSDMSWQCVSHELEYSGEGYSLQTSQVDDQLLVVSNGVVTSDSANNGRLTINITSDYDGSSVIIPFWIVSTDYENYALAYSCNQINDDFRAVYGFKLSRTYGLSDESVAFINTAMEPVDVLNNTYFEPIDQSLEGCFYLPDLEPGEPVILVGQCESNIPVVRDFQPDLYTGRWRLLSSYPTEFQNGSCNDATYTLLDDGTIEVYNTQVIDQSLDTTTGSAVLGSTDGTGVLLVTFPGAPTQSEYYILDTDYTSYSFVYSCVNINERERRIYSWILSRNETLPEESLANINAIINNVTVLSNRFYQTVNRTDDACFYFPEADGRPVVFRGQCDENIDVVQSFNVTAYLGEWHAIQSYPQEFQFGSCQRAEYTLNENGIVDVYNTQVFQQRLDAIYGTAAVASDDGSAKLDVTFNVNGSEVVSPYWVLDTDYENYALVYSCVNLGEEYQRVTSWKMSRERNLTDSINNQINSVMSDIRVLDQRYFVTWGHSDEQCFFYPPLTDGRVVLDGRCEDEIADVVENFNATGFAGTWYETERFPSELQTGDCTINELQQTSANTFTLTKSIVYNERLQTFTGTATLADVSTGVLSVNLVAESGASINMNLHILDTDYDSYALLYSCRNYDDTRKQVFSWKLSRYEEGLTDEANEAIDQIVTDNVDLFEDYYEAVARNNDVCFYYPEFDVLPEAIELPGLCDSRIVGVPNFDAGAYTGRWFEVARYPQLYQNGTCSRAHYDVIDDAISVLNTEVVDTTLNSQAGTARLASSDGSGVIEVTYNVNNVEVTATLYVLATDYSSYSLVYSCQNLTNSRLVSSWKLSRERTLNNDASAAIDEVISTTQGLNNEYYQSTDQSDEACFYVPPVTDQAPVFRQPCDNVTGQENFDIQRFVGWWHEIYSYPRDEDAGECVSSNYEPQGNQIRVVDTGIFNLTAQITSGTVVAESNGRLIRTINNGTASFVQDIWALATDYETYALLYSCETVDNDEYRRVWSAKYSKSRLTEFPEAANAVMDDIISENQVLYPQFYQPTNQNATACFHYPEQTGQQVILPGQCDENIPVEENFSPVAYTGTWYQIERYPQIHETGECTGARYSLDQGTGIVTVLNWEVVDGALQTIEGTAVISSEDGSGRLTVSLPFNGTDVMINTTLYVLTTDYVSYSVAYSCYNIDDYFRSVGAWKLSRTRTLPAPAVTAINQYMELREELHQPYFIPVHQSGDCQEPNSSAFVTSSIIVTVLCLVVRMLV